jgi:5-methylthioadenosine/S-adenosylhomocysteine deaminase
MQDIDLIISGGKALLMNDHNTCLENAGIAVNASSIIDVNYLEDPKYKVVADKLA